MLMAGLSQAQQPLATETRDECLTVLRAALAGDEFWPAMHAAEALTLAGEGAEVKSALLPRLKTEIDHQRRCGLAREITRTGDRTVLGELWKILADEKSSGRVHAAESLYKIAEIGDGKLLRAAMAQDDNLKLTLMAAAALGRCGNLAAIERVRKELASDDRETLTELAMQATTLTDASKVDRLLRLVDEYPDKMVIFTQFRATQELLRRRLEEAGHGVAVFHGGLSRLGKEAAINDFRGRARLLLATESGSEGRNLQFAHAVCNFDLPWNPMRIEQRIGRLSRIGQTQDIHVFNLVAAGTVEEAVLHLLEAKLNLFELVIGEVDMILGNLDEEREFEDVVADLWAESDDLADFRARMEQLGERLLAAKRAYLEQRAHDDRLFGDRFAPDR
jgi:hypothetical protein